MTGLNGGLVIQWNLVLVAAILGADVLHEQLGVTGFAGIALILLSILVPHLPALANAVKKGYTESSNPERKSVL